MARFFKKCGRFKIKISLDTGSVVDPNTLNLDPDPVFWPNMDPDLG